MGSQDYHLGQPRKTLVYARALQYWAERVKPLIPGKPHQLAGSILLLRQAMEPLMTFQDSEVLGDDTNPWGPEVCHNLWAHPRRSFSVAYSERWPGPSIGQIAQTPVPAIPLGETLQSATPTDQSSPSLPGLDESAGEPPWAITLPTPPMEVVEAAKVVEVEEVADTRETEKDMALATLGWTQIHPSRAAVLVELVPHSLGDEQCCCHSHRHHRWRKTHLWAEQDQQSGDTSGSAPGSPMTTHNSSPQATSSPRVETSMEGTMVRQQAPSPGFTDIANTLQRIQPLWTPLGLIEEQAPTQMAGSTLVMSQMMQDAWGNLFVDMVTYQLSVMGMGPIPWWLWWQSGRCPPQRCPQIWLGSCPVPRFFLACTPTLPHPRWLSASNFVQNCVFHGVFTQRC